jgi:hypothetical protein
LNPYFPSVDVRVAPHGGREIINEVAPNGELGWNRPWLIKNSKLRIKN